jgi:hypothetical protein
MKIWEPRAIPLERGKHEANRLYLLHIKRAQLGCFVVRGWGDEVAWF